MSANLAPRNWLRRLPMGAAGLLGLVLMSSAALAQALTVDTSLGHSPFAMPPDISYPIEYIGSTNTGILNHTSGTYNFFGGSLYPWHVRSPDQRSAILNCPCPRTAVT